MNKSGSLSSQLATGILLEYYTFAAWIHGIFHRYNFNKQPAESHNFSRERERETQKMPLWELCAQLTKLHARYTYQSSTKTLGPM